MSRLYLWMLIRLPINLWTPIRLVNNWVVVYSMILLCGPLLSDKMSCMTLISRIPKLSWPCRLTNNRLQSMCMSVRNMRYHIWLSRTMRNQIWLVLNTTWLIETGVCWDRAHRVWLRQISKTALIGSMMKLIRLTLSCDWISRV